MSFDLAESVEVDVVARARAAGEAVRLPGEYTEYALAVQGLLPAELLAWCRTVVLERRAGSYEFVDLFVFLLAFFSSADSETSLAEFADSSSRHGPELAGLAGRTRWMSQASLSRGLAAVGQRAAAAAAAKLMEVTSASAIDSPLASAAGYRDGQGDAWTVFHWDTTVTTLRQRALPEGEELPEPSRLAAEFAAPGYPGRKRGEVQVSRSVLQDATSAAWLHVSLQPGNGQLGEQLDAAARAARRALHEDPARMARAVVVADGVGGGTLQAVHCDAHGLAFLTRWANYDILELPEQAAFLDSGPWRAVVDSKSGPRREAMQLGTTLLRDTIPCRVIVTRFCAKREAQRGAGRTRAGWHHELFITTLPAERWAPEDLVTLYYGRTAIENRFAAENREFNLARVFSYTLPGQLLAYAVAMAVWNLRCTGGLAAIPETTPCRALRHRPPSPEPPPRPADDQAPAVSAESAPSSHPEAPAESPVRTATAAELAAAAAARTAWCAANPLWQAQPEDSGLRCPAGHPVPLGGLRRADAESTMYARFRAPRGLCPACPLKSSCSPKASGPAFCREVTLRFPLPPQTAAPSPTTAHKRSTLPRIHQTRSVPAPPYLPESPVLLPAVLRRKTLALYRSVSITVLAPEEPKPDLLDFLCEDDADRQRRRLDIDERVAINERREPDDVATSVTGPQHFLAWFKAMTQPARSA